MTWEGTRKRFYVVSSRITLHSPSVSQSPEAVGASGVYTCAAGHSSQASRKLHAHQTRAPVALVLLSVPCEEHCRVRICSRAHTYRTLWLSAPSRQFPSPVKPPPFALPHLPQTQEGLLGAKTEFAALLMHKAKGDRLAA